MLSGYLNAIFKPNGSLTQKVAAHCINLANSSKVPLISLLFSPALAKHAAKPFFLNDAYMEGILPVKKLDDGTYSKPTVDECFAACKSLHDEGFKVTKVLSENLKKLDKSRGLMSYCFS